MPNAFILRQKNWSFFFSVNSTIFADFWEKSHQVLDIKNIDQKKKLVGTLILQCAQIPKPKLGLEGWMPSTTLSFYFIILFKSYWVAIFRDYLKENQHNYKTKSIPH